MTLFADNSNFRVVAVLIRHTSGAKVSRELNTYILWKNAIAAEALFIVEKELALSIRDCVYNAIVMSSTGRDLLGHIKVSHQRTKVFQGPT